MNKEEVYKYLRDNNIEFEITEHPAVFRMGENPDLVLPYPGSDAKNLFIRDKKKQNYYLITVKGPKRVDLKAFRQEHGTTPLSFASEEDLWDKMELKPGSVTPLGLLNKDTSAIRFFLDRDFFEAPGLAGIHPNENTATVWIKPSDLIELLERHGNTVELVDIKE